MEIITNYKKVDFIFNEVIDSIMNNENGIKLNKNKIINKLSNLKTILKEYQHSYLDVNVDKEYGGMKSKIVIYITIKYKYHTEAILKYDYSVKQGLPIKYIKALISEIDKDDKIQCHPYLTDGDFYDLLPKKQQNKINKLQDIVQRCIDTAHGCPDKANLLELHENGIKVHKGDSDSYGWLTAILLTQKGSICLG